MWTEPCATRVTQRRGATGNGLDAAGKDAAQEHPGPPGAGRGGKEQPLEASERCSSTGLWVSDSSLQDWEGRGFCCWKPPSVMVCCSRLWTWAHTPAPSCPTGCPSWVVSMETGRPSVSICAFATVAALTCLLMHLGSYGRPTRRQQAGQQEGRGQEEPGVAPAVQVRLLIREGRWERRR